MRVQLQWLILAAVAGLLAACPKQQPAAPDVAAEAPATAPAATSGLSAEAVAESFNKNCSICHGKELEGREGMAPALTDIKANWTSADELVKYLNDPQGYADKDARLAANRKNYSLRMPDLPTMTDDERRGIADWLLSK